MNASSFFFLGAAALLPLASVRAQNATITPSATTSTPIAPTQPPAPKIDLKYSFGPQPVPGYTQVKPTQLYSPDSGFGFDLGSQVDVVSRGGPDPLKSGFSIGAKGRPFFFSTKLAPGAYRVTVTVGDSAGDTEVNVKSETRRLMLESVRAPAGQFQTRTFLVHVRIPQIPGGQIVALKPRERDPILYLSWDEKDEAAERITFLELDWDEKLILQFSGAHANLTTVAVTNADSPITVYLIGDSTVTDQMMEPWGAWGMFLPRWFKPPVLIANYAESGETTASFISERRWPKLLSEIHPGDYVFMQFGINDQRLQVDQFKQYFVRFINDTREHGAHPVLVTSQNLRRLDANGKAVQTLRNFPDAMKEVATEMKVPLIDLNAMSMTLYEAIGPEKLPKAFVDGTHQNGYGAYELAKCVVNGIVENKLPWAQYLVDDWKPFDPAHPDALEDFKLPRDPQLDPARPGGPGLPPGAPAATRPGSLPQTPAPASSSGPSAPGSTVPTTPASIPAN